MAEQNEKAMWFRKVFFVRKADLHRRFNAEQLGEKETDEL